MIAFLACARGQHHLHGLAHTVLRSRYNARRARLRGNSSFAHHAQLIG